MGLVDNGKQGFYLKVFTSIESEGFLSLFNLYRRIFSEPDEAEDLAGIKEGLVLNNSDEWQQKYGPFKEYWIGCFLGDDCVGGVNFATFSLLDGKRSAHINYIFTDCKYRRMGVALQLLENVKDISEAQYIFCEQNDPTKMSSKQLLADKKMSGISTLQRLAWWSRRGFRKLDFNYVQPALAPRKRPCKHLSLFVLETVQVCDSKILFEHLLRFYNICVMKCRFTQNRAAVAVYLVNRAIKEYEKNLLVSENSCILR